jgi:hypothetical protein
MKAATALRAIFRLIIDEAERNPEFAERLDSALQQLPRPVAARIATTSERRPAANRRRPGVLNPFEVFKESGPEELRARLNTLDVERLKDIIAEHGMDPTKLAMKWKTGERLIQLIVSTVEHRRRHGEAFRSDPSV